MVLESPQTEGHGVWIYVMTILVMIAASLYTYEKIRASRVFIWLCKVIAAAHDLKKAELTTAEHDLMGAKSRLNLMLGDIERKVTMKEDELLVIEQKVTMKEGELLVLTDWVDDLNRQAEATQERIDRLGEVDAPRAAATGAAGGSSATIPPPPAIPYTEAVAAAASASGVTELGPPAYWALTVDGVHVIGDNKTFHLPGCSYLARPNLRHPPRKVVGCQVCVNAPIMVTPPKVPAAKSSAAKAKPAPPPLPPDSL